MDSNQLQVKDKMEVDSKSELTRSGPVFLPSVDIYENQDALVLVADMPGVDSDGIELGLEDYELTIRGGIKEEETDITPIYSEYQTGDYYRRFTLSNIIDQEKIEATIKDGVLKVTLPKAEALKPRKIEVKAG